MRLEASAETRAAPGTVFAALTDLDAIERGAARRGILFERHEADAGLPGTRWNLQVRFHGHARDVALALTEARAPERLGLDARSGGIDGRLALDVIPASSGWTCIDAAIELHARTIAGRLLLGSLAPGRGTLARQLDARLKAFARDLDDAPA